MKASGIICLVVGIILILLNIAVDLTDPPSYDEQDNRIAFFIGAHLFIIVGLGLLVIPFIQYRKSNKRKRSILDESIENIGK